MNYKILLFIFLVLTVTSCQTRIIPVSKRSYINKASGQQMLKRGRVPTDPEDDSPNIYVKRKKLRIEPVEERNNTGSLLSLDNPENYLFSDMPKGKVGDTIVVLTRVNKGEGEKKEAGGELEPDKLKDELLAALPEFTPRDSEKVTPLTSIKMKIDRRLPNGDVIVSSFRMSKNDKESNTIRIQARLTRSDIMNKKEVTTNDLQDVEWYERKDEEVFERQSLAWEDEYTMRLSGFSEAKSKFAEQLVSKEKDLNGVREKLRDRINALGTERRMIAKAREDVDNRNKKMGEIVDEMQTKIKDQDSKIEEQKSIIKKQSELLDEAKQPDSAADQKEGAGK